MKRGWCRLGSSNGHREGEDRDADVFWSFNNLRIRRLQISMIHTSTVWYLRPVGCAPRARKKICVMRYTKSRVNIKFALKDANILDSYTDSSCKQLWHLRVIQCFETWPSMHFSTGVLHSSLHACLECKKSHIPLCMLSDECERSCMLPIECCAACENVNILIENVSKNIVFVRPDDRSQWILYWGHRVLDRFQLGSVSDERIYASLIIFWAKILFNIWSTMF